MCAGAIYQSRIKRVVFGAYDLKQGALGGAFDLYKVNTLNHFPEIEGGVLKEECSTLISSYFKEKRK